MRVLLLTKDNEWGDLAAAVARAVFQGQTTVVKIKPNRALPDDLEWDAADVLISYLCPVVIPGWLLNRFPTAINFHPGSTAFPGTGCYNFALYFDAKEYGAVCHHMTPNVDAGEIIEERTFPILPTDTVETLNLRTMVSLLDVFHNIATKIASGEQLPKSTSTWKREPFTRSELNALCIVRPDMTAEEIARRVRATSYPGRPGAVCELGGVIFTAQL